MAAMVASFYSYQNLSKHKNVQIIFLELFHGNVCLLLLDVDGMLRHSMFQSYNWQWLAFQVADTDTLEPNVTVG